MGKKQQQPHFRYGDVKMYGHKIAEFDGLEVIRKSGKRKGQTYTYVVYREPDGRIKWKIAPTLTHNNRIQNFKLYHHNRGRDFHVQLSAWGNRKGLLELFYAIAKHEAKE
jgi:hypothetical protein